MQPSHPSDLVWNGLQSALWPSQLEALLEGLAVYLYVFLIAAAVFAVLALLGIVYLTLQEQQSAQARRTDKVRGPLAGADWHGEYLNGGRPAAPNAKVFIAPSLPFEVQDQEMWGGNTDLRGNLWLVVSRRVN